MVLADLLKHYATVSGDLGYGSLRSQGRQADLIFKHRVLINTPSHSRGAMRPSFASIATL